MANTDSIDATHPLYDCRLSQWQRCWDCWRGQDAVKARDGGRRYLPPTEGMILDGAFTADCHSIGHTNYQSYLDRALFYGFYADAVTMALGLAWTKEPIFEGLEGTPLEYLLTNATNEGESLCRLLYRINEAQLNLGRIGLMADMPAGETAGKPQPYITCYGATEIINWDAGRVGELNQETLNLVVLNESGPVRTGTFEYNQQERYRVLALGPLDTNEAVGVYRQGVFTVSSGSGDQNSGTPSFDPEAMYAPTIQGRTCPQIPFVFVNATSATSEPCDPPLLSLSDLVLNTYKLSADYSLSLHASCSPTLVTKGLKQRAPGEKQVRLGSGGHVELGSEISAEAKFLEIEGKSIPEMRQAVQAAKDLCQARAGEVIDTSSRGRESGSAMESRISVRTANLHAIVQSGATGLERLLKIMGRWLGMEEDKVALIKCKPNYLFSKPTLSAIELKSLVESKLMGGALLSLKSIHTYLVSRGFTTLSFEELRAEWESEKDLAKDLLPEIDLTKTGGPNGGPKIPPVSTGI